MKPVYSARDEMQAEFLVQVLAQHEIEAKLRGAALQTLAGYLPAASGGIEVCVDEADVERAQPVVKRFDRSQVRPSQPPKDQQTWTCPKCGEAIEPQFTDCWNCQTPRPGVGESEATKTGEPPQPPPRLPPDPHIPVDLKCIRCDYNLRGLPVDRACPECAHPALASLLQAVQSQPQWAMDNEPRLAPCLDYVEGQLGFPMEAIRFVIKMWPRALSMSRGGVYEAEPYEEELVALRDLAADFLGDPISAVRAIERWGLTDSRALERLIRQLAEQRVIEEP